MLEIYIYIIINYQVSLAFIEDKVGGADLEKEEESIWRRAQPGGIRVVTKSTFIMIVTLTMLI